MENVTDWAITGPLEKRQSEETLGLTNETFIEPNFNSSFDTIPASSYQIHHKEVDEAFVRMGLEMLIQGGKRVKMKLKGQNFKAGGKRQGKFKEETKDCGGTSPVQRMQWIQRGSLKRISLRRA